MRGERKSLDSSSLSLLVTVCLVFRAYFQLYPPNLEPSSAHYRNQHTLNFCSRTRVSTNR
jgi:hypothetical protein